ncbi:MAG: ribosome maturation factor RimP [Cyclobacteriaceae bacterium]|jgi:ribosome maturation factor RimP|nr:ribosome maturation factor RimP [Cyclobacteriaceae bacterium]
MVPVEEIRRLAESSLEDDSQFLVDVKLTSGKGPSSRLLVIVDGDNGVSIDSCAAISRKLSKALDDAGLLEKQYVLEVSSPGLDQPLKGERQYRKNVGRRLRVTTDGKIEEGLLERVTPEGILLSGSTGKGRKAEAWSREIPFSEIRKAIVLISFK